MGNEPVLYPTYACSRSVVKVDRRECTVSYTILLMSLLRRLSDQVATRARRNDPPPTFMSEREREALATAPFSPCHLRCLYGRGSILRDCVWWQTSVSYSASPVACAPARAGGVRAMDSIIREERKRTRGRRLRGFYGCQGEREITGKNGPRGIGRQKSAWFAIVSRELGFQDACGRRETGWTYDSTTTPMRAKMGLSPLVAIVDAIGVDCTINMRRGRSASGAMRTERWEMERGGRGREGRVARVALYGGGGLRDGRLDCEEVVSVAVVCDSR